MNPRRLFRAILALTLLPLGVQAGIIAGSRNLGAIWFIGDSITQSNLDLDPNGSPRKALYDLLVAHGYTFTYTGHSIANVDGLPGSGDTPETNLYQYHSGISGSVIGDNYGSRTGMTQNLPTFWISGRLATVKPDVVLIMLGTNDINISIDIGMNPARLPVRVGTLVNAIYYLNGGGNPTIFVASIAPNRTRDPASSANTAVFNAGIPGVVSGQQAIGRDVHFVDQFTPLDTAFATTMIATDNLHPNSAGNLTIAQQWFKAIDALGGSAPPYAVWAQSRIARFRPAAGIAASDDPDGDGKSNLYEFAFNGDPLGAADHGQVHVLTAASDFDGDAAKELILTVAVRAGTPVFSGSPSPAASHDGITYAIEGGPDLNGFAATVHVVPTAVTAGLPPAGPGYEYRSFSLGESNGLATSGFLRAKVTQP